MDCPRRQFESGSTSDEIDTAIVLRRYDGPGRLRAPLAKHYKLPQVFRLPKTVICPPENSWYTLTQTILPKAYLVFTFPRQVPGLVDHVQSLPSISNRFDTSVAAKWLQECCLHHRPCSRNPDGRGANEEWIDALDLRLIDCRKRLVVAAPQRPLYLALSYVWGSPTTVELGDANVMPSSIPNVVQDAMQLALALGFRYLWVDRYCIPGDDPEAKHVQIQRMHDIYRNAEATIIAAAGTDGSHGLPGMKTRSRDVPLSEARTSDFGIKTLPGHPGHAIRSSAWASRGWTYQEAALSRRRLVFTDYQVYFECGRMTRWESLESLRTDPTGFQHALGQPSVILAIEAFTHRNLTFDNDSLNAFAGILSSFQRKDEDLEHLWGVPYPRQNRSRKPENLVIAASHQAGDQGDAAATKYMLVKPGSMLSPLQRQITTSRDTGLLVRLCWAHKNSYWARTAAKRPRRRPEFPSWSWVGWEGDVYWPASSGSFDKYPHLEQDEAFDLSLTYCISEKDTVTPSTALKRGREYPRALNMKVWVVPTTKVRFSREDDGKLSWTIGEFEASVLLSDGPETPEVFLEALKEGSIDLIWLATTSYHVEPEQAKCLAVEKQDGRLRRIGVVNIHCMGRPLKSLEEPGATGKECFQQRDIVLR
ncbi:hypothetical protein ACJ41O_015243 [Fusarium nematophilum]